MLAKRILHRYTLADTTFYPVAFHIYNLSSDELTFPCFCGVHSKVILFTHGESIIGSQSIDLHFGRVPTRFNLDSKRTLWNSPVTVLDVNTVAAWFFRYVFDSVSSITIVFDIYRKVRTTGR